MSRDADLQPWARAFSMSSTIPSVIWSIPYPGQHRLPAHAGQGGATAFPTGAFGP